MINIRKELIDLAGSGNKEDLKQALQAAIELEHSTMPPYLYAFYSLGRAPENKDIRDVLMSIAIDEMTHMLLAANLLKSIGGSPVIDSRDFVPNYPTHLPGSVAEDLVVPLKPFSRAVAKDVFMRIEQPDNVLDFRETALEGFAPVHTIGEFYGKIRGVFDKHGKNYIVDTTGATQPASLDLDLTESQQRITSKAQAFAAIDLIVEQGEGTGESPFSKDGDDDPDNDEYAHYYRFAALIKGRIKRNPEATASSPPDQRFVYDTADPVPFDESKVLKFRDNPKAADFAEGSPERNAIDEVNRCYTRMLQKLHIAFNGSPSSIDDAIDEMRDMHRTARSLYRDFELGPTFEYSTA